MRSEREMYQLILGYAQQDPRVRGWGEWGKTRACGSGGSLV